LKENLEIPAYPTFDTFTGWTGDYKTKAFGYDYNLNDDSSSLLYIPTVNDPIVCYSYKCTDEGSADALAREEAVLNLLTTYLVLKVVLVRLLT
jgi:hypothetical protein